MSLKQVSPDVFLASTPVGVIGPADISILTDAVHASAKGRVRINLHQTGDDLLHEMLIAILPGSYVRPHKHLAKSESFHVIRGACDVVVFDDQGEITEIVQLKANDPADAFCYRMSAPLFHTVIVRSDIFVVHEITNGPFHRDGTSLADFSPKEDEPAAVAAYLAALEGRIAARLAARP